MFFLCFFYFLCLDKTIDVKNVFYVFYKSLKNMFFMFFYFLMFLCSFNVVFLLLLKHKRTNYKYDAFLLGKLRLALFSICTIITYY